MATAFTTQQLRAQKENRHDFVKKPRNKIILILDRLLNNHNLGAILRVADAGLVEKVLIHDSLARTDGKKALSSARGVAEWVPHEKIDNAVEVLRNLKADGYKVWALELCESSVLYHQAELSEKIVLIVGNEMTGISQELLDMSDIQVFIPMAGMANSLNVATATSIAVFDILRRKSCPVPESRAASFSK